MLRADITVGLRLTQASTAVLACVLLGAAAAPAAADPTPAPRPVISDSAQEPVHGRLRLQPLTGRDITAITAVTGGGCPEPSNAYLAVMSGPRLSKDGLVVTQNNDVGLDRTRPFALPFRKTLRDFASEQRTTLRGHYTVTVRCIDSFLQTIYATYSTSIDITGSSYTAVAPDASLSSQAAAASDPPVPTSSGAALTPRRSPSAGAASLPSSGTGTTPGAGGAGGSAGGGGVAGVPGSSAPAVAVGSDPASARGAATHPGSSIAQEQSHQPAAVVVRVRERRDTRLGAILLWSALGVVLVGAVVFAALVSARSRRQSRRRLRARLS